MKCVIVRAHINDITILYILQFLKSVKMNIMSTFRDFS